MPQSRYLFLVCSAALTFVYWWSGFTKLWDFAGAQAEMAQFGLNPPALYAGLTILVQLGGAALFVFGQRFAWMGAIALGGFTVFTIPVAHRFWEMNGVIAVLDKALVQEHISLIGGLMLAALMARNRANAG